MDDGERAAIHALQQGDIGGLEPLFAQYQLRALRVAYLIVGERQAAEDVVAEAFLTVYDRIGQFDERRPFAPWFYRIVTNGALMATRRTRRQTAGGLLDTAALTQQVGGTDPDAAVLQRELQRSLSAAIDALPPPQRAALVLHYYLDLDQAAVTQALGCPVGTVKWRLYMARRRLRRHLGPELELSTN